MKKEVQNEKDNLDKMKNIYTNKYIIYNILIIMYYIFQKYFCCDNETNNEEISHNEFNINNEFDINNEFNISTDFMIFLNKDEFKNLLINKYNKCIVSDNDCYDELEVCYLIEYRNDCSNNIYNGLVLESNLHSTFKKNLWCINPHTLEIVIKDNHIGSITKYKNKKVSIELNQMLYINLLKRYTKFLSSTH